jgi:aspartate/methionine/tyrosine aminotransferase
VRKIFDLAGKIKDPINLSIGEPDFDIPDSIKEEGIQWIRAGFNKYTPSGGIPELREKVLLHLRQKGIIGGSDRWAATCSHGHPQSS